MNRSLKALLVLMVLTATIFCNSKRKNKLSNVSAVPVTLSYSFKTREAEQLSVAAFSSKQEGNYNNAINLYNQAISIERDNPKLFFDLSECYARNDQMQKAITCLDTCVLLDPTYPGFYNNRGFYYYKMHESGKAILDLKKATSLYDKNYVLYVNLALAYYANNDMDKACNALNRAKLLGLNRDDLKDQNEVESLVQYCNKE